MKRLPAAAFALMPGSGLACALPPSVILTLPTGHYITGAALTVAMTATLGALTHRLPQLQAHLLHRGPDRWPLMLSSYLGFLAFGVLVALALATPDGLAPRNDDLKADRRTSDVGASTEPGPWSCCGWPLGGHCEEASGKLPTKQSRPTTITSNVPP